MFVIITAKNKQGKTSSLKQLMKHENINKPVFINEMPDYKAFCNLRQLLIKYLALGYESFFIDDIETFVWDEESKTIEQNITEITNNLEKMAELYNVNIFITTNRN